MELPPFAPGPGSIVVGQPLCWHWHHSARPTLGSHLGTLRNIVATIHQLRSTFLGAGGCVWLWNVQNKKRILRVNEEGFVNFKWAMKKTVVSWLLQGSMRPSRTMKDHYSIFHSGNLYRAIGTMRWDDGIEIFCLQAFVQKSMHPKLARRYPFGLTANHIKACCHPTRAEHLTREGHYLGLLCIFETSTLDFNLLLILHSGKLTWQRKSPRFNEKTSSNGGVSIAMLVFGWVIMPSISWDINHIMNAWLFPKVWVLEVKILVGITHHMGMVTSNLWMPLKVMSDILGKMNDASVLYIYIYSISSV